MKFPQGLLHKATAPVLLNPGGTRKRAFGELGGNFGFALEPGRLLREKGDYGTMIKNFRWDASHKMQGER